MATKSYRWLGRLIDKITKEDCPNNNYFEYYGHRITLQSGTRDYMDVYIRNKDDREQVNFTYDFWTDELTFFSYNNYDERNAIIKAFKSIYRSIDITDEPWEEERKFYEPMLDNDEYDHDCIKREYDELMNNKAA